MEKINMYKKNIQEKKDMIVSNIKKHDIILNDIKKIKTDLKMNFKHEKNTYEENINSLILKSDYNKRKNTETNNNNSKKIRILESKISDNEQSVLTSNENVKNIKKSYELKYKQQTIFINNLKKQVESGDNANKIYRRTNFKNFYLKYRKY